MDTQYGVAVMAMGSFIGKPLFVVVTDGQRVEYIDVPDGWGLAEQDRSDVETIAHALQTRIDMALADAPDEGIDAAEMLEALCYNMPYGMEESEKFTDWDTAYAAATQEAESATEERVQS